MNDDTSDLHFKIYYKTATHVLFVFDYYTKEDLEETQMKVAKIFFVMTLEKLQETQDDEPLITISNKNLYWL